MKSVLISIQPKWCAFIAQGLKTIEIRKTAPKLVTPFKCYIYATSPKHKYSISKGLYTYDDSLFLVNRMVQIRDGWGIEYEDPNYKHLNRKVIGEFICDEICKYGQAIFDEQEPFDTEEISELLQKSKLTYSELRKYVELKDFYTWHISELIIYDEPKKLTEFITPTTCKSVVAKKMHCNTCCLSSDFCTKKPKRINKAPQSWCYVEELKGENNELSER